MATVDFVVTKYGKGYQAGSLAASTVRTSGQDTITTVENLEDAGGDITVYQGEVLRILASAKMRIAFGGTAATATTGHLIPADSLTDIEIAESGTVSMIEGT